MFPNQTSVLKCLGPLEAFTRLAFLPLPGSMLMVRGGPTMNLLPLFCCLLYQLMSIATIAYLPGEDREGEWGEGGGRGRGKREGGGRGKRDGERKGRGGREREEGEEGEGIT